MTVDYEWWQKSMRKIGIGTIAANEKKEYSDGSDSSIEEDKLLDLGKRKRSITIASDCESTKDKTAKHIAKKKRLVLDGEDEDESYRDDENSSEDEDTSSDDESLEDEDTTVTLGHARFVKEQPHHGIQTRSTSGVCIDIETELEIGNAITLPLGQKSGKNFTS